MHLDRVLLAHGDPVVQELATRALSRLGVALEIAPDSADALSLIARNTYSVICLDRDDAVIAAIAATCAGSRPVVIVTADDGQGLDPHIVSLFVPVPYDPHTLVGVILACVTPIPPADFSLPATTEKDAG